MIEQIEQILPQINRMTTVASKGYVVTAERGTKYVKLVRASGESRSVWCFIDKDGSIWKPAGWAAPAKNFPRGTIKDLMNEGFVSNNIYGF